VRQRVLLAAETKAALVHPAHQKGVVVLVATAQQERILLFSLGGFGRVVMVVVVLCVVSSGVVAVRMSVVAVRRIAVVAIVVRSVVAIVVRIVVAIVIRNRIRGIGCVAVGRRKQGIPGNSAATNGISAISVSSLVLVLVLSPHC